MYLRTTHVQHGTTIPSSRTFTIQFLPIFFLLSSQKSSSTLEISRRAYCPLFKFNARNTSHVSSTQFLHFLSQQKNHFFNNKHHHNNKHLDHPAHVATHLLVTKNDIHTILIAPVGITACYIFSSTIEKQTVDSRVDGCTCN